MFEAVKVRAGAVVAPAVTVKPMLSGATPMTGAASHLSAPLSVSGLEVPRTRFVKVTTRFTRSTLTPVQGGGANDSGEQLVVIKRVGSLRR